MDARGNPLNDKMVMLSPQQKHILHDIAYHSIEYALDNDNPLTINLSDYDEHLQKKAATFVTLKINDALRGCIGILTPIRPLIEDVAHNAHSAAFNDHRFSPLKPKELVHLSIHISVLNTPTNITFDSEEDLIKQLQPGEDGIIIEENTSRATFLPSVWESINNKKEFLQHLKQKANLPKDYWSDTIKVKRYSVESF